MLFIFPNINCERVWLHNVSSLKWTYLATHEKWGHVKKSPAQRLVKGKRGRPKKTKSRNLFERL
jgi:hypothetical protein